MERMIVMNIPYVFKKCTKCGEWLVASTVNFHKKKAYKYGSIFILVPNVSAICFLNPDL